MTAPLRFGVICRDAALPAWQARALEKLLARDDVALALVILEAGGEGERRVRPWEYVFRRDRFWTLYLRFFVARRSLALRPVDMSPAFADVTVLPLATTRLARHSVDDHIAEIRRQRLDFVLWFGSGVPGSGILTAARYGVWSFHHGADFRRGPRCFWEIYRAEPVTEMTLRRLTDRLDTSIVLHEGFFRTIDESYVRSYDQAQFGSADWPARVCADIMNGNSAYLDGPPRKCGALVHRRPGGWTMARFLVKQLRNLARNRWRAVRSADHWNVGVVDMPIHAFVCGGTFPGVRWLTELPRGRFLADPFGITDGERLSILAEEFDYATNEGRIVIVDPTSAHTHGVLDTQGHAAYPYLFRDGETVYCVPEVAPNRGIHLFRAADFPTRWEKVGLLVPEFAAQDATVFAFEGRWWLMCTDAEDIPNAKLHAWFASDPIGPWTPHPLNPLKTDVRSSRPGGTPFIHEGCLYRPAQDDSTTYGAAVVVNRVVTLTPTEFEEMPVTRINPVTPYSRGLHTLSAAGDQTLIDGKRDRFTWPDARRHLPSKLQRRLPRA